MKITQSQYFEIEEYFTDKCRLVEEEFIQEMTDHFVDGIEVRMSESVSFEAALGQTIEEFGGTRSIRKMELSFQKSLARKLVREWWQAVLEYARRPKLYRSVIICLISIVLVFWVQPGKAIGEKGGVLTGFITGALILPVFAILGFIWQPYSKWIRSLGPVSTNVLVMRILAPMVIFVSILLFAAIVELFPAGFLRTIFCSFQLSISFVVFIASFGHFNREELESWYRPKLLK